MVAFHASSCPSHPWIANTDPNQLGPLCRRTGIKMRFYTDAWSLLLGARPVVRYSSRQRISLLHFPKAPLSLNGINDRAARVFHSSSSLPDNRSSTSLRPESCKSSSTPFYSTPGQLVPSRAARGLLSRPGLPFFLRSPTIPLLRPFLRLFALSRLSKQRARPKRSQSSTQQDSIFLPLAPRRYRRAIGAALFQAHCLEIQSRRQGLPAGAKARLNVQRSALPPPAFVLEPVDNGSGGA